MWLHTGLWGIYFFNFILLNLSNGIAESCLYYNDPTYQESSWKTACVTSIPEQVSFDLWLAILQEARPVFTGRAAGFPLDLTKSEINKIGSWNILIAQSYLTGDWTAAHPMCQSNCITNGKKLNIEIMQDVAAMAFCFVNQVLCSCCKFMYILVSYATHGSCFSFRF